MTTSQNGWPIVGKSACDQGPFHGVTFPNGILAGDVAYVARWMLEQYAATVEPIVQGTCWGWFVKVIEGTATASNHGSATAWDVNADQHVMGTPASASFTTAQIRACHDIVDYADGVIRWGGDYTGRPDPMHWEINKNAAAVKALANKIRSAEVADVDYDRIHQMIDQSVAGIFKQTLGDAAYPGRTAGAVLLDLAKLRGVLVGDPKDTANAVASGAYEDTSPLARVIDAADVTLKPPTPPPAS